MNHILWHVGVLVALFAGGVLMIWRMPHLAVWGGVWIGMALAGWAYLYGQVLALRARRRRLKDDDALDAEVRSLLSNNSNFRFHNGAAKRRN